MDAIPPPVPVEPVLGSRGFKQWPLWAKISAPIVALLIVGGTVNALGGNDDKGSAPADTQRKVLPLAADNAGTVAPTAPEVPATTRSATPTTTVALTTALPTTAAPTTPPPTTPAPTAAPPLPSTIGLTVPPPQPANDPRFDTCKEAKAHGYGPYVKGQDPEYSWYRDADGDGIVCE